MLRKKFLLVCDVVLGVFLNFPSPSGDGSGLGNFPSLDGVGGDGVINNIFFVILNSFQNLITKHLVVFPLSSDPLPNF